MSNITKKLLVGSVLVGLSGAALALDRTTSKENTSVYIISPANGETVSSPVKVQFGLAGMGVAPAGVTKTGTGHHHLIIDGNINKIPKDLPIGAQAKHFGGGQTETTLVLTKGKHTLQLLLADKYHIPHLPVVNSAVVKITVK
jgi:hypothetical protein